MRVGVVFLQLVSHSARDRMVVNIIFMTYASIASFVWTEGHRCILHTSISKRSSSALTFTDNVYAANMFERNLRRWQLLGDARVFISLRQMNIPDLGSFFGVNFYLTFVGGCTRSLTPIFTGRFANLKLATEDMLLLDARIQQVFEGTLMNLA